MDRNLALAFTTVAMAALGAVSLSTGTEAVRHEPAALVSVSGNFTRSAHEPQRSRDNDEVQDAETEMAAIDGAPVTYEDTAASEDHEVSSEGSGTQPSSGSAWASRGPRGDTQFAADDSLPPMLAPQVHF